jgi:hypothetical protein
MMVVRPVMRMSRGIHRASALMQAWRTGAVMIVQRHAVMRHVRTMALSAAGVALSHRLYAEIATGHGATALSHALALANRATLTTNIVTRAVRGIVGHVPSPMRGSLTLNVQRDGNRLFTWLADRSLAANVLRYCLTGGAMHKRHDAPPH